MAAVVVQVFLGGMFNDWHVARMASRKDAGTEAVVKEIVPATTIINREWPRPDEMAVLGAGFVFSHALMAEMANR